jgi:glycosyltransferase involved in cell wall biosynthesis
MPADVGLAYTTHNRPKLAKHAIAQARRFTPNTLIVVVDDGSSIPFEGATFRSEEPRGIARAKNKCLELLMAAGIEHMFLFDDDTWPIATNWWTRYVDHDESHLCYLFKDLKPGGGYLDEPATEYQDDRLYAFAHPRGCMLYLRRHVVERVGGMRPEFGKWGHEHVEYSHRIHNAGLSRFAFQGLPGDKRLIWAGDEHRRQTPHFSRSIDRATRTAATERNQHVLARFKDSSDFVEYRDESPVAAQNGEANVIDLSVLICSTHTRSKTFGPKIQAQVWDQYNALPVEYQQRLEILMLTDNRKMILGDKRQRMIEIAQGRYVQFIDDDDRIEPDMFQTILDATSSNADVITFGDSAAMDGKPAKLCTYSISYAADRNFPDRYERLPNHKMATKRELALKAGYPSIGCGEDSAYAKRLHPHLTREFSIKRTLYHYDFSTATTEAQEHLRTGAPAPPPQSVGREPDLAPEPDVDLKQHAPALRTATVDIVMLSNAQTEAMAGMAQATITSCLKFSRGVDVNMIVVEQNKTVSYDRANLMIHRPEEFHFNRFANDAIRLGSSPWVTLINSDLTFHKGWLRHLLAANHAVVSPKCPKDERQAHIYSNAAGFTNAVNFSGWCFLIKREIWERIGGFDECVRFWCSDDVVIEQLKAIQIAPMLVANALVTHNASSTLNAQPTDEQNELTFAQLDIFNAKYKTNKMANNKRYQQWKRRQSSANSSDR